MLEDYICGKRVAYVIDDTISTKPCLQLRTKPEVEPQFNELRFAEENDDYGE